MNTTALKTVRELLGGDTFPKCDSASLRLEKFVRLGDKTKKAEIDAVVGKTQQEIPQEIPQVLPKGSASFVATLGGRLIVNQAGGVLENAGLCLHPHFNAPYIPGSAVKGCARHAAWQVWDEASEGETKAAAAKDVAEIFGYPTGDKDLDEYLKENCGYEKPQSGKVAFLAAVPEKTAKLVVDVVTCHHPKYYEGERDKAFDDEEPIPCPFPAVEAGTKFVFTVVPAMSEYDVNSAIRILKQGLVWNGIGAKTSAGYGWFDIPEDKSNVETDEGFLRDLELKYRDDKGRVRESFKRAYKKGEITFNTDSQKKAVCLFLKRRDTKVGGEFQKNIDKWSEQFGVSK